MCLVSSVCLFVLFVHLVSASGIREKIYSNYYDFFLPVMKIVAGKILSSERDLGLVLVPVFIISYFALHYRRQNRVKYWWVFSEIFTTILG